VIGASVGTLLGFLVAFVPALFVREPQIDVPPLPPAPPSASHASSIVNPQGSASAVRFLGEGLGDFDDDDDDEPSASASSQPEKLAAWEASALVSGIDKAKALKTLRLHYDLVDDCYQEYRGKLKGQVRLGIGFSVGSNGSVGDIRISENSAHSRELQACVTDVFKSIRFRVGGDSEGGSVSVRYVFE